MEGNGSSPFSRIMLFQMSKDADELLTAILSGQAAFITPDGYAFTIDIRILSRQAA